MENLHCESEYIKNMLEDEKDVEEILKTAYNILKFSMTYGQYIACLMNVIYNYKNINYTKENIVIHITIVEYFMLNIQDDFFNHIIDKYIIDKNQYYDILYTRNSINCYLLKKMEQENNISNNAFEYIFKINKQICNEITKLHSQLITPKPLNKCKFITHLNIKCNNHITNVNHLTKLEELHVIWYYGSKIIQNLLLNGFDYDYEYDESGCMILPKRKLYIFGEHEIKRVDLMDIKSLVGMFVEINVNIDYGHGSFSRQKFI